MPAPSTSASSDAAQLELLKALGDNTRHALYLAIARSPRPLSTAELAEHCALHPNTVRPHLERMRDVGLLELEVDARGGVGRPQHRYSLAADAPSLGVEPPAVRTLSSLLSRLVDRLGGSEDDAAAVGRQQGAADAATYDHAPSSIEALVAELDRLGFDPIVSDLPAEFDPSGDAAGAVVAFGHCPFGAAAESRPDVVCGLHRGLVEGFVDGMGDAAVDEFCTLVSRTPCQVAVSAR